MKWNKYFMLGLAGLAFTACSNEEELENLFPEGKGAVSVRIVTPTLNTRGAGAATSGDNGTSVSLTGDLTVTLTGSNGYNEVITIDASKIDQSTVLKFWNVETPEMLTVSINGGKSNYSSVDLSTLQVAAVEAPAYGETTTFNKSTDTTGQKPNHSKDNDLIDDGTEQGADEDGADDNTVYQMYEATVTMRIPLARLEVSNIQHTEHTGDACIFTSLIANGAYLDGYTTTGGTYSETGFTAGGSVGDFSFDGVHGTGAQSALRDVIGTGDSGVSFMGGETLAGPFTYNFYANGTNPQFKIYFGTATGTNIIQPRYAIITNYKKLKEGSQTEYESVTFENGKIYRITSAKLKDENIIGDEGGNTLYGVEVTVVEATWTLVDIVADWES